MWVTFKHADYLKSNLKSNYDFEIVRDLMGIARLYTIFLFVHKRTNDGL